jgi:hypothetical protein
MADTTLSVADAFSLIAEKLESNKKYSIGSFWEFTRDIWAQGFDNPEYFKAWHVGRICEDIEDCLEKGIHYVGILPRAHFKSTILGHAFSIWRMLKMGINTNILYLSYSDTMAKYHIGEINKEVNRNPVLAQWMRNKAPRADFTFRYDVDGSAGEILHGGLFSFKRGMHVNGALIADDILRDPENPLAMGVMKKIEDHFLTESLFIPNQGVPIVIVGTPMMPGDLLSVLEKDDRFFTRKLPALDPEPGRRVLFPEMYTEKFLLDTQAAKPKSFASEFLLQPAFNTEAYFTHEEISRCEDRGLRNLQATIQHNFSETDELYAGFDVGKKRHPSHLVIFKRTGQYLEQVHQSWLDGWDYSAQIEYLNEVAKNFNITKGYVDNTRGELEDRGLSNSWWPMSFSSKSKHTMAQIFEEYVNSGNLKLLADERQKQQILSVSNDLKAPETPMGHGDAFFSVAMALTAAYESSRYKIQTVGDLNDVFTGAKPDETGIKEVLKRLEPPRPEEYNNTNSLGETPPLDAPNPKCTTQGCSPSVWVPENKLCLLCLYRG